MRGVRILIVLVFLGIQVQGQTYLGALFTMPTQQDINTIKQEWQQRDLSVHNWRIETSVVSPKNRIDVVAHEIEDSTHYGFIRYPRNYDSTRSYPIVVANHSGRNGTSTYILEQFKDCLLGFFVVVPSYRGEMLDGSRLNIDDYHSQGKTSVLDTDVDDALTMLNGVVENIPAADSNRIAVFGASRGATVACLMNVRDTRIKIAVVYSPSTDLVTYPGYQKAIEDHVDFGAPLTAPADIAHAYAVKPYLNGQLTLIEARLELLRRSVIHFVDYLTVPMQIHAGASDTTVEPLHTQRLQQALQTRFNAPTKYESFVHNGLSHNNVEDSAKRHMKRRFCKLTLQSTSIAEAVPGHLNVYPNPFNDHITISNIPDASNITINNGNGQLIFQQMAIDQQMTIDLKELSGGMYHLNVIDRYGRTVRSRRLIKSSD